MADSTGFSHFVFEAYQIVNITLPSVPFIFQVCKFFKNQSSLGFSRKLSLSIILAHIMRIFFWFGKKFHWSLLAQSVLVLLTQLFVLSVAIKFRGGNDEEKKTTLLENKKKFYELEWDNLGYYILFFIGFSLVLEGISLIFTFENKVYVETLGTLSSFLEAALTFPQIFENCRVKSTQNLSKTLVGCWIVGDALKTFYFFVSEAPLQLLISGFVQIFLDIIVVLQCIIYRKRKVMEVDNHIASLDSTSATEPEFDNSYSCAKNESKAEFENSYTEKEISPKSK